MVFWRCALGFARLFFNVCSMLACGTNWFLGFDCCIRLHTWFAARIGFFLAVFLCFGKAEKCVQMRAKNWFPVQRNWFPVPMRSILVNFFFCSCLPLRCFLLFGGKKWFLETSFARQTVLLNFLCTTLKKKRVFETISAQTLLLLLSCCCSA